MHLESVLDWRKIFTYWNIKKLSIADLNLSYLLRNSKISGMTIAIIVVEKCTESCFIRIK